MKGNNEMNGLNLKTIKSTEITGIEIASLTDIKEYITNSSYVIAYLDNEVLFGTYENSKFSFPNNKEIKFEYLKRVRIFNLSEELHIWFSKGKFAGRYRKDENGIGTDIVEANQVLYGTDVCHKNGFSVLTEERGTKIELPNIPQKWNADNDQVRVAVRTRHYIEYSKGFQAGYCDARFVQLVQLPEKGGE